MERENRNFWDILIWVAVLMGGLFGLEGLLLAVTGADWIRVVYPVILMVILPFLQNRPGKRGKGHGVIRLDEWVAIASAASSIYSWVFFDKRLGPKAWWLFPVFIVLQARSFYKNDRKRAKEQAEEEDRLREPLQILDRMVRSDRKMFIVISHAEQGAIQFEMDGQMFLYTVSDDRFLVLFKQPPVLEVFLKTISAFRTEVDADEDVIGYYGPADDGSGLAYVSTLAGECRTVPFDPASVPLDGAFPV